MGDVMDDYPETNVIVTVMPHPAIGITVYEAWESSDWVFAHQQTREIDGVRYGHIPSRSIVNSRENAEQRALALILEHEPRLERCRTETVHGTILVPTVDIEGW